MEKKEKKLFLIKNESDQTVGTFFAVSIEKLEAYINEKKLYPKTDITIEEYIENNSNEDVEPLLYSERFLWYELRHEHCVHVVK